MQNAKVNIMIGRYPYGGNGGTASEVPEIGDWLTDTIIKMKADERIGEIYRHRQVDTPAPMVRNATERAARSLGCDFILMVDSDQAPDKELLEGDPQAKPFWDTSFDFAYKRRLENKVTVIGAPYCGPPPNECCYVFRWTSLEADSASPNFSMQMYTREEAAQRGGVEQVAALPTGLILFDVRAFDLVEPPYFYYEYTDKYCSQKASTEDVTATRDISLHARLRGLENPIFCNWDAWAGHWKPKCVRKPRVIFSEMVGDKYKNAVLLNHKRGEQMVQVGVNGHAEGCPQPSTKAELHNRLANHDVVLEPR